MFMVKTNVFLKKKNTKIELFIALEISIIFRQSSCMCFKKDLPQTNIQGQTILKIVLIMPVKFSASYEEHG